MVDGPEVPDLEVDIPFPGGLKVTADQPYHVLVVADFAGSDAGSVSGPLAEGVVPVTADTFDDVMAAAAPRVTYNTTDPLTSANAMVEVDLRFDSLRAFDPGNIVPQIPAAKALTGVRSAIVNRLHGKTAASDLASAISLAARDSALSWLADSVKWTPAEPVADRGVVQNLLGPIPPADAAAAHGSAPPPRSPIGAAVAAAVKDGSGLPSEETAALRRTLAEIDRRLTSWLTAVLHGPQVQSLESAWRALAYLVTNTDFRKRIRLSLLHAPAAALSDRLISLLIDPVFDEGADAPDLIVVDRQFGNSAADLELLDELAQHGASLPAVVITGVSSGFFGVKNAWQMATLPPVPSLFDQYQFAKWRSLRDKPFARSLAVVFGRFLLRNSYAHDGAGAFEFAYKEPCISDKDFVWAGGALGAAVTAVKSFARNGWPTGVSGYVHGRLEGLKIAEGGKKGDKKFGPTDTNLPEAKIEELGAVGVNALVGLPDRDDALFWNGMTAAKAPRADVQAVLEVSLPYQLFATRISALLFALKPHLSGMSPEKLVPFVTTHVRDWVPFEGQPGPEQLSVQVRPAENAPNAFDLAVTVTPPQAVVPGGLPVAIGYRLT